jgi:hypothetical protein
MDDDLDRGREHYDDLGNMCFDLLPAAAATHDLSVLPFTVLYICSKLIRKDTCVKKKLSCSFLALCAMHSYGLISEHVYSDE